jgi:hypothetical protein
MITVVWNKRDDGGWCRFHHLILDTCQTTSGVYMIWHAGQPGRVVYVGQAGVRVRDRITEHRLRDDICAYRSHGELYVTWAAVPPHLLDRVERYLADTWKPLVGDAHPQAVPLAVNSPW